MAMRTAEVYAWVTTAPWRVEQVRRESHDVVTLGLTPASPFSFEPGQFSMLYLAGIGEVPISISGSASGLVLHTIRDVGAVTHALCALAPGQHVGVRGPYGTAWPVQAAYGGDLVIVAGGIGLPPLRPAIYQALASREQFGRIVLLYGARTPADLLFTDELAAWRGRFDLTVEVTVDSATPSAVTPGTAPPASAVPAWRGNVG